MLMVLIARRSLRTHQWIAKDAHGMIVRMMAGWQLEILGGDSAVHSLRDSVSPKISSGDRHEILGRAITSIPIFMASPPSYLHGITTVLPIFMAAEGDE
mgnify:CR=1 FL=1